MKKRILAVALSLTFTLAAVISGCGNSVQAADLMADIKANTTGTGAHLTGNESVAIAGFAVRLFQDSISPEKNTLISPLSVLSALAMTANGAKGETLSQMEDVFGLSVPQLNGYLHNYLEGLPSDDKYKVSMANSIWFKDDKRLKVEQEFLQTNADYYDASIYKAPFDDATLKDINTWVSGKTDGMIKNILDEIPDEAVMYLINALAFDAEWENIYKEYQIRSGTFTTENGEKRTVEMMYGPEEKYLSGVNATGFLKYYSGRKYAFAALLPNQGITVADLAASLTGEELMRILGNPQSIRVSTAIPKFKSEYSVEMSGILKTMGMSDAFDVKRADLRGLGQFQDKNLFIDQVIHKTFITVDEKGTRAGAATAVGISAGSAAQEYKTVYLDRPFIYMLIDCGTNLPIFIGAMMDTGN